MKMPKLPELTSGTPVRRSSVTALPIFAPVSHSRPPGLPRVDYELGADAIARGDLEIRERARGAPGQLRARNRSRQRAFLIEGRP